MYSPALPTIGPNFPDDGLPSFPQRPCVPPDTPQVGPEWPSVPPAVPVPVLTLPPCAIEQTNPEFERPTELKIKDANFSMDEHRAIHARYFVARPDSAPRTVAKNVSTSSDSPGDSQIQEREPIDHPQVKKMLPIQSGTSFFEQASHVSISGGHFSSVHTNIYPTYNPDLETLNIARQIVEKDASFNRYSSATGLLKLPTFTKDLLLNVKNIHTDSSSRPILGSCCFGLAWRLGLLPGQANSNGLEYDQDVPIARIVTRGTCCAGRISRHGFVHLVSRFFQNASVQDISGGGTIITVNTTIGRFKCYDIDDQMFVHFDISTRSLAVLELVDDQDLDHILQSTRGQYLMHIPTPTGTSHSLEWRRIAEEDIPTCAVICFFSLPNAIMYMSKQKMDTWKLLSNFGRMVLLHTLKYINTLSQPESFCRLLREQDSPNFDPHSIFINIDTPPKMLSYSFWLCRIWLAHGIVSMTCEEFVEFARACMKCFWVAHKHYRSPQAEHGRLLDTSQERFLRMFRLYVAKSTGATSSLPQGSIEVQTIIESELHSLMQNTQNNIALVVYQAFFGIAAYWNAARLLARSREVPLEWIQFVVAEDDYIYLA